MVCVVSSVHIVTFLTLMADAKLSVTGAKPGIKKLDVAQVVSMGTESHITVFVQVFQSIMIVQKKFLMKSHQIVNQEKRIGKSRDSEARTKKITPETQESPENPKSVLKKK